MAGPVSRYGKNDAKFSCSKPSDVARQRDRMMTAYADFARDYELRFTP
jgi:hypothetical protein